MMRTICQRIYYQWSSLFTFAFLFSFSLVNAQYLIFNNTTDLGNSTFQITPDSLNTYGSVWYKLAQDAKKDLDINGQMYFGAREDGADGIVFVMQNNCVSGGTFGGGIGYAGMPGLSLGIEFDTYQNIAGSGNQNNADPSFDHVAIHKNGNVRHTSLDSNLAGPVQMHVTNANVEDDTWHDYRITWNATTTELNVYFDGVLRLTHTVDIINDIFNGDDVFYWGFTSATGGSSAANSVQINPPPLYGIPDPAICIGDTAQIQLPVLNNLSIVSDTRPTSASSTEGGPFLPSGSNDGDILSRWASLATDDEHLTIDLEDTYEISQAEIQWETAAGMVYDIQISDDSLTWTTVASVTDGVNNEFRTINFTPVKTRYVRMQGITRTTGWGYSIYEFKVYGVGEYNWTPSTFISDVNSSNPELFPPITTTYQIKVPDNCNGPTIIDMTVYVDDIQLTLGPDFTICEIDTLSITPIVTGAFGDPSFVWSPVASTDTIFKLHPPVAGTYQAIVTDTLNCKDTSSVTVSLDDMPTAANAGLNDTICVEAGTYSIVGNNPAIGTGRWNLVGGTATIDDDLSATTSINDFVVDTVLLEWQTSNGVCPISRDTVEIVIHQESVAGVLTGGLICPADSLLLELVAINGDSIVWESSTDNSTFTEFGGNDTSFYAKQTDPTYYRATVKFTNGKCSSVQSNTVLVDLEPLAINGTMAETDLSYCTGSSVNLTLNGASGNITWQESIDSINYTTFSGAAIDDVTTTISATTTGVTDTLYYRTMITSTCDTVYSDTVRVVIHPEPTAGVLTGAAICPGDSVLLDLVGIVGDSIVWESSLDNMSFTTFGGNDTSLYVKPLDTTYYRASVKFSNGACASDQSNTVQVAIQDVVVRGLMTDTDLFYCTGSSVNLTLNGASGNITWQESTDSINYSTFNGAAIDDVTTTISATTTGVTDTLYYRTMITSSCDTVYSDTVRVVIHPEPTAGVLTGAAICPGDSMLLDLVGIVGDSIVWESSLDNVLFTTFGGNDTSLYVRPLDTTYYRAGVKFSNGICANDQSNTVQIDIQDVVIRGLMTDTDLFYCTGSSVNLTLSGASGNITWQESTDSINYTTFSGAAIDDVTTTVSATTTGVTDTLYYRTMITSSCDTVYSDTSRSNSSRTRGWVSYSSK